VRFFIAPSLAADQLAFVGSALFAAKAPCLRFLFAAPLADFAFEVHAYTSSTTSRRPARISIR
jgi:hypothetical protein